MQRLVRVVSSALQRLPNGSIDANDDGSRASELQELLDRTSKELAQSREHSAMLNARVAELEAELTSTRRELSRSEELSIKQQREQREVGGETFPKNSFVQFLDIIAEDTKWNQNYILFSFCKCSQGNLNINEIYIFLTDCILSATFYAKVLNKDLM